MKTKMILCGLLLLTSSLLAYTTLSFEIGNTYMIAAGDPHKDGSATVEVTVKYTDPVSTQRKEKVITVTLDPVSKNWTAADKANAIKDGIQNSPDNDVGGKPLVNAGIGLPGADVVTVAPAADNLGDGTVGSGAEDINIEGIDVDDKKTGENDKVIPPVKHAAGVSAIGTVSMSGDITGLDADNQPSVVDLLVGNHFISKTLTGTDTRKQVAEFFLVELRNRGIDAVLDRENGTLIIVLTDDNLGLGVGSTDLGITISGSTMTAL